MHPDNDFIEHRWNRLASEPFSQANLAILIKRAGGADMSDLSDAYISDVVNGQISKDRCIPSYPFSEILSRYKAAVDRGYALKAEDVIVSVWTLLILSDAIRNGSSNWDQEFNIYLDAFLVVRKQLKREECAHIFIRSFGQQNFSSELWKA